MGEGHWPDSFQTFWDVGGEGGGRDGGRGASGDTVKAPSRPARGDAEEPADGRFGWRGVASNEGHAVSDDYGTCGGVQAAAGRERAAQDDAAEAVARARVVVGEHDAAGAVGAF